MRYVQFCVFLALLLAVGVCAAQNTGVMSVNFLSWNLSQPVALFTLGVYILGTLSDWAERVLLKGSFRQVPPHASQ